LERLIVLYQVILRDHIRSKEARLLAEPALLLLYSALSDLRAAEFLVDKTLRLLN
jgi:hypothetical protein